MGLNLWFRSAAASLNIAHDGLAPLVRVNMLNLDGLLGSAPVTLECLDLVGERAHQLVELSRRSDSPEPTKL